MASNQATAQCSCPSHLKESVLTLDGGGMRGYASLLILHELLKEILQVEHELDNELDNQLDQASNGGDSSASHHRDDQLPLPCHYFNYVFGTSTGGIIALLLGRMRLSIEQCLQIYKELGAEIFRKKEMKGLKFDQYSHKKMERLMKKAVREHFSAPRVPDVDILGIEAGRHPDSDQEARRIHTYIRNLRKKQVGANKRSKEDEEVLNELENTTLYDPDNRRSRTNTENIGLEKCRVGLIATRRGEKSHRPHLFRSYRNTTQSATAGGQTLGETDAVRILNLDRQDDGERRITIWEAARATSAAPHYFKRIKVDFMEYMDGGLVANNPAWHAWYEASSMHIDNPWGCGTQQGCIRFLVSLGTGKGAPRNLFTDGNMFHQLKKIFGLAMAKLTDPEGVHDNMSDMINHIFPGARIYTRFNVPSALQEIKLDECEKNDKTFNKMFDAVQSYLRPGSQARDQMRALARQLVKRRRSKCRIQHQRYEGLSNSGPIDPAFSDRFLKLHDIPRNRSSVSGSSLSGSRGDTPGKDRSAENIMAPAAATNNHITHSTVPVIGRFFPHDNSRVAQRHSS